jgi:predicted Holliday junction resolvase-like endonuclease
MAGLVVVVIVLSIVLFVGAIWILIVVGQNNGRKEEIEKLTKNMHDIAHSQYQAWVDRDSQGIRTQQLDLARREASATLEEWKSSSEVAIRSDAIQRSQSVILGKVTEHLVPFLPSFKFNPKDARFIGSPIDILVFDGMDQGELRDILFIEVKTGPSAALTARERQIRDAIRTGRVKWQELRVERLV